MMNSSVKNVDFPWFFLRVAVERRNVIDSKGQGNTDTKFVVKIDNKGVEYKDLANNVNARILGIDFSKGDRVVEITGTQMTP
jgi:hypothetical protein